MNELYWMVVIVNRQSLPKFEEFFRRYGADVHFVTVGRGTAASEILDFFGLEANEKGVLFTVVCATGCGSMCPAPAWPSSSP